jgi:hypothetical protein
VLVYESSASTAGPQEFGPAAAADFCGLTYVLLWALWVPVEDVIFGWLSKDDKIRRQWGWPTTRKTTFFRIPCRIFSRRLTII